MLPHGENPLGALATLVLSVERGELSTPERQIPLPHHRRCETCGFDRWDGASDHPWAGVRFAARMCTGRGVAVEGSGPTCVVT